MRALNGEGMYEHPMQKGYRVIVESISQSNDRKALVLLQKPSTKLEHVFLTLILLYLTNSLSYAVSNCKSTGVLDEAIETG